MEFYYGKTMLCVAFADAKAVADCKRVHGICRVAPKKHALLVR